MLRKQIWIYNLSWIPPISPLNPLSTQAVLLANTTPVLPLVHKTFSTHFSLSSFLCLEYSNLLLEHQRDAQGVSLPPFLSMTNISISSRKDSLKPIDRVRCYGCIHSYPICPSQNAWQLYCDCLFTFWDYCQIGICSLFYPLLNKWLVYLLDQNFVYRAKYPVCYNKLVRHQKFIYNNK